MNSERPLDIPDCLLPEDPEMTADCLAIHHEIVDQLNSHRCHPPECPWRDPQTLTYAFGLTLSRFLAELMKNEDWSLEDVKTILESIEANTLAVLKASSDS